jgi:hypothetical protein
VSLSLLLVLIPFPFQTGQHLLYLDWSGLVSLSLLFVLTPYPFQAGQHLLDLDWCRCHLNSSSYLTLSRQDKTALSCVGISAGASKLHEGKKPQEKNEGRGIRLEILGKTFFLNDFLMEVAFEVRKKVYNVWQNAYQNIYGMQKPEI